MKWWWGVFYGVAAVLGFYGGNLLSTVARRPALDPCVYTYDGITTVPKYTQRVVP